MLSAATSHFTTVLLFNGTIQAFPANKGVLIAQSSLGEVLIYSFPTADESYYRFCPLRYAWTELAPLYPFVEMVYVRLISMAGFNVEYESTVFSCRRAEIRARWFSVIGIRRQLRTYALYCLANNPYRIPGIISMERTR